MIKAVVFDMDGVLFDTERLAQEAWKAVGREEGVELPDSLILQCVGLDITQARELFCRHFGREVPFDRWRELRIAKVFETIRENGMPEKPGLYEILDYLNRRGIKKALATSSHRSTVDGYFNVCRIGSYFDAVISAEAVEKRKPDPAIYRKAAAELGLKPEECMAVEDSPVGVLSAFRAGLKPVMIPDLIQPDQETEKLLYARLESLDELTGLLEVENGYQTAD